MLRIKPAFKLLGTNNLVHTKERVNTGSECAMIPINWVWNGPAPACCSQFTVLEYPSSVRARLRAMVALGE